MDGTGGQHRKGSRRGGRWEGTSTGWLLATGVLAMVATAFPWDGPADSGSALAARIGGAVALPEATAPGTGAQGDLTAAHWVRMLESEGLEGALWRLRALAIHRPGARDGLDVPGLVAAGRRAVRAGHVDTAVDIHTLAVTMDPGLPDAYLGLADACLAAGDPACAGRAYRALARSMDARRPR